MGATIAELAEEFGVTGRTINNWKIRHKAFHRACRLAARPADDRVERGLYERAVGYTFEAVEIHVVAGKLRRVKVLKHVPPDVTAQAKWLHNRRPGKWREKQSIEHSGPNGGPMSLETLISQTGNKADEPAGE
jgi:hypothetical protein